VCHSRSDESIPILAGSHVKISGRFTPVPMVDSQNADAQHQSREAAIRHEHVAAASQEKERQISFLCKLQSVSRFARRRNFREVAGGTADLQRRQRSKWHILSDFHSF
jgi:hypothetical protein